jgi:hypothetical protein
MLTDTLVLPLDRARTRLLVSALRIRVLRGLLLDKPRRIGALLVVHAGVAFVLAVFAPTVLLLVGPLLLGVPHLVSDVRYLVLRPLLSARTRAVLLGGSALILAVRGAQSLGFGRPEWPELALSLGMLVLATLTAARPGAGRRVALALGATALLAAVGAAWPQGFRLALSHLHNLAALALWALAFARQRRSALTLGLGVIGLAGLLLATPLAWFGFQLGLREFMGLHALAAADTLAVGVHSAKLALGIVASFAFLQSVHYAVWLHAVPQEQTRGNATLTFRMSARKLRGELGAWGLAGVALLSLGLPAAALVASPLGVKNLYLSLSSFHAYLELAAGAVFFVGGLRPRSLAD